MASGGPQQIPYPPQAKLLFTSDGHCRRIARVATWAAGSRVLDLSSGASGLQLARDLGCMVTVVGTEAELQAVEAAAQAQSLGPRVVTKKGDRAKPPVSDGDFDGVVALGAVYGPLQTVARNLRRYLASNGRLVMSYPVKVGRAAQTAQLALWEARLGEAPFLPRDVLQQIAAAGFEPESIETLSDAELDEYYKEIEPHLATTPAPVADSVRKEIALHRAAPGRSSITYALIIARRKEPGEKPPPSRSSG